MVTGVPLFDKSNLMFYREEKEGYVTFVAKNHPELRELVINPTGKNILSLCDGKKNIENICRCLMELYPGISGEVISKDVSVMLASFSRLGIITWEKGVNPFLYRYEEEIEGGFRAMIAQEEDIGKVLGFLEEGKTVELIAEDFCSYCNPLSNSQEYSEVAIRQKVFSFAEEFFLLTREEKVKGLLSFVIPVKQTSTSVTIGLLYAPSSLLPELMTYAINQLRKISVKEISKIKLIAKKGEKKHEEIGKYLERNGFLNEATLNQEIGLTGLNVYSICFPLSKREQLSS